MKQKPDIVVVGGGPCGSYAAYTAAKLGAEVLVCEEHETIGAPRHCAGHLNISSLRRLGLHAPRDIVENEIRGAVFCSPSGKQFVLRCRAPVTYVVNRELFDKHLAELAIKAGVKYRFKSGVRSLILDSGVVKGVALRGKERVEANVVVDAEGCSSKLLKETGLQGLRGSMMVRGVQAEVDRVEDVEMDMVEVYLGNKVAPGFFAWIIPRKDGSAKVGLATETGDPRKYLRMFMEKHPVASEKLKKSRTTYSSFHPIPLAGPIPKTFSDGFLVVGDAASQVKPTTGGGVIFGLTCAREAGKVAYEAVNAQFFSEAFLSRYQHRWKRLVGFDLAAMLQMRRMLNSLSDSRMDGMIDLCTKLGVDSVLEKVGDLDFQGRSLVRMITYPGALAVISYFLFSWLTSTAKQ
ncbi:MAG TPA: NAD(P)/FAD-dependent oxidoreductase [Candidatus Bathyarchaeota archaeon]|nr:NAD(P)/FAD-dependent oxidoreductase [Candidatus Bathyarchaeota archaeon]